MTIDMNELLQLCVDEGASDLHIRVNVPPMLRIHGSLTPLDCPALTPAETGACPLDFFRGLDGRCQQARRQ